MPCCFNSISTFRDSLEKLCNKKRDGYTTCQKDICELLGPRTFDEIWEMNTRLKDNGDIRILKIRVQNSGQSLSSSDGFRLIVMCNRKHKTITFLNVYPKKGKHGMLDQGREETKRQVIKCKEEAKIRHDIQNHLKIISDLNPE